MYTCQKKYTLYKLEIELIVKRTPKLLLQVQYCTLNTLGAQYQSTVANLGAFYI